MGFCYCYVMNFSPEIVAQLDRLFWDKSLAAEDFERYPHWVVRRVLEYGQLSDVHALRDLWGRAAFLKIVSEIKFTHRRTENFWHTILQMEGLPCTKRSSPHQVWPF